MKKVTKGLATVGMTLILAFGSVSGLAAVHAASDCGHGTYKDVFNPIKTWTDSCTKGDETCTMTYTRILHITYCTSCGKNLGESTFDYYVHSNPH